MEKEKILSEIEKIKYLYRFKKIIRYNEKRIEEISTESDAEHIFGMMILANYFLEQDQYKRKNFNREKVYDLILFHEMDELEYGDINTYEKTKIDKKNAIKSLGKVFGFMPDCIKNKAKSNFWEYENQKTAESKFVFWLDKIEPIFHLSFNKKMAKTILNKMKLDLKTARKKKEEELKGAGLLEVFLEVLYLDLENCFYKK